MEIVINININFVPFIFRQSCEKNVLWLKMAAGNLP